MPEIKFPSDFLKMNINCKHGDIIKFKDAGTQNDKGQWTFVVEIYHNAAYQEDKKFSLNKGNFNNVSALYGTNSDAWVGKEMEVNLIKSRNPQTGLMVDSVLLMEPAKLPEGL